MLKREMSTTCFPSIIHSKVRVTTGIRTMTWIQILINLGPQHQQGRLRWRRCLHSVRAALSPPSTRDAPSTPLHCAVFKESASPSPPAQPCPRSLLMPCGAQAEAARGCSLSLSRSSSQTPCQPLRGGCQETCRSNHLPRQRELQPAAQRAAGSWFPAELPTRARDKTRQVVQAWWVPGWIMMCLGGSNKMVGDDLLRETQFSLLHFYFFDLT